MSKYRNVNEIDNHMLFGNDYDSLLSVNDGDDAYDDYVENIQPLLKKGILLKETKEEIAERLKVIRQLDKEQQEAIQVQLKRLLGSYK